MLISCEATGDYGRGAGRGRCAPDARHADGGDARQADAPLDVPYHHGCFMLMRTDALDRSGGFDPRFFMYPEDIDLTRRMHRIGSTVWYPGATIVHAHRAESKHNSRMRRIHIVNMLRYFRKWGFFFDRERRRLNRRLFSSLASAGK